MMKKRIASALLALCLLLPMLPATVRAEGETSGEYGSINWSYDKSKGALTISAKNNSSSSKVPGLRYGNWDIPYWKFAPIAHTVNIGDGITEISDYAFYNDQFISNVTISDTVTKIGQSALSSMSLFKVEIPSGVTTIGENAFYCVKVTYIPNTVTEIGKYAFHDAEVIYFGGTEEEWAQLCKSNPVCFNNPTIFYNQDSIPVQSVSNAGDLQNCVNNNTYVRVQLTGNIDFQSGALAIPAGHILDLDLNHYNIIASGSLPVVTVEGKLVVEDSTADEVPEINSDDSVTYSSGCIYTSGTTPQAAIVVKGKGYFKLDSGSVQSTSGTAIKTTGEKKGDSPVVCISGGYVKSLKSAIELWGDQWNDSKAASKLEIYGGVLHSTNDATVSGNDSGNNDVQVYLVGGTIISQSTDPDQSPCGIYVSQRGYVSYRWGSIRARGGIGIHMKGGYLMARGSSDAADNNSWNQCVSIIANHNVVLDQQGNGEIITYDLYCTQKDIMDEPVIKYVDGYKLVQSDNIDGQNVSKNDYRVTYSFAPNPYTVTFDLNYEDAPNNKIFCEQTVNYLEKATKPEDPTREGYTFGGWYTNENCTTSWDFEEELISNNTTFYAKWVPVTSTTTYTITFHANGGRFIPNGDTVEKETEVDGTIINPPTVSWDGHTFTGWFLDPTDNTQGPIGKAHSFTADTSLYAHWIENDPQDTVAVSFDPNYDGAEITVTQINRGYPVQKPADPQRENYTFAGWFEDKDGTKPYNFSDLVIKGFTLYASWTKNDNSGTTPDPGDTPDTPAPATYTITFDPNKGTVSPTSKQTDANGKLDSLPTPTRSGHTFDGWFTAASGGEKVDSTFLFTSALTVYAHWTANPTTPSDPTYRIYGTGSVTGGRISTNRSSATEGTRITIDLTPRNGYELEWIVVTNLDTDRSVDLTERDSDEYTFLMPAGDVEIEASFASIYRGNVYYEPAPSRAQPGPTAWYYSNRHIYHVTDGLVPDSTPITRDMLISVLYNLTDESLLPANGTIGSQTNDSHTWAASSGIIPDIYASGLWGLDKALTRDQMALMVFQYAGYRGYSTSQRAVITRYRDYGQVRAAAREAMSWAIAANLMSSTSSSTLSPQDSMTCGQTGELLYRLLTTVS